MKLKQVGIRNFKRFKDLTIQGIPESANLVVMLGPNGCGKSSLFDAFQRALKVDAFYGLSEELIRYYRRGPMGVPADPDEVSLEFHGERPTTHEDLKKSLYMRSAFRHDPSFGGTSIQRQGDVLDRHSVQRLIDWDQTVQNNYQRIVWRLLRYATTPGLTTDAIINKTIGDVQKSMEIVFGDVVVDALVSTDETGTFTFTKGDSKSFLYENLSAGEKAAFDLLLDVVVNRASYDNSLYCIDEPEAHLNTRVQRSLLKELCRLVPAGSQLWIATHSIGMVTAAQAIHSESPEEVVFLDMGFDTAGQQRNYDLPQVIEPSVPSYQFWKRHYVVALDDLADLLMPDYIVLCEGLRSESGVSLDEACYSRIFAAEFPQARFVSVGGASDVETRVRDLVPLLDKIVDKSRVILFRDRDSSTSEEIMEKRGMEVPIRTMSMHRNIESLLLCDGVLMRLCAKVGKPESFDEVRRTRERALENQDGQHASDDFKPVIQAVQSSARTVLNLTQAGESRQAFLRDVLAPLVAPGTPEYQTLKEDIFGA